MKKNKMQEVICANDLVGCFGKLPLHHEFIKHRVLLSELVHLDRWYQTAYYHLTRTYNGDLKTMFLRMPLQHFIYFTPTQLPLLGTLLPSSDKSGRAYPFVTFRLVEHPLAREFPWLIPASFAPYFQAAENLCKTPWQTQLLSTLFADIDGLKQAAAKISRHDILEKTVAELKQYSFSEFWQQLTALHSGLAIASFIGTVLTEFSQLTKRIKQGQVTGLRLPLLDGVLHQTSIIFWLQLLDILLQQHKSHCQIFWHQTNAWHAASLLIYFKALPPAGLSRLITTDFIDNQLIDVIRLTQLQPDYAVKFNSLNLNLTASLLQMLQVWSKPQTLALFQT